MPDPKRLAATLTPAARGALEQAAGRALRPITGAHLSIGGDGGFVIELRA